MNRYLKLVNFEINRFIKIYLTLIIITFLSQFIGIFVQSKGYVSKANQSIYEKSMTNEEFINQFGKMDLLHFAQSIWFLAPIALCSVVLILYIFLIWYRDWFGKNTFAYRLLMLPTSRLNVFFSKATAIFLMVIGLIAFQIILLPIENSILKWIVPSDFRNDMSIKFMIESFQYLYMMIPGSFIEFILYYGAGLMMIFILFTGILIERSFYLKGILFGFLYCVAAVTLFLSPILLGKLFNFIDLLYPIELVELEIVLGLVVIGISIWLSRYLIEKKVTV
jgi:hypothetical protein